MAVDLKKNRDAIVKAWKDVSDPNGSCSWALYGYEGQTPVLKLVETGESYEDMVESLNSGKLMYAYVRVTDPNTGLPKFVFINWQGEGVPETLKGKFTSHVKDVAALLHGAHVTINARTEADVDYSDVLKLVAKSSGANYSIHKEKAAVSGLGDTGPVGSVYQKVLPQKEIRVNERDQFWQQAELEEKRRVEEERKKQAQVKAKAEEERKQREAQEEAERERLVAQRAREAAQQKAAWQQSEAAAAAAASQGKWDHSDRADDEDERRNRSESLRKQRAAEAASLVQHREANPREIFKQRERALSQEEDSAPKKVPPVPKKLTHGFNVQPSAEPSVPPRRPPNPRTAQKQEEQFENEEQQQPSPPPVRRQPSPPPVRREPSPPPVHREPSPPPVRREPSPPPARRVPSPPPVESPPPEEAEHWGEAESPSPAAAAAVPALPNLLAQGLPKRQAADSDQEASDHEQDWDEPSQEHFELPTHQVTLPSARPPQAEGGLKARALYDYQAGADDELTFDPEEIIYEIEQIDEGWWMGTTSSGRRGIFPANYVELI